MQLARAEFVTAPSCERARLVIRPRRRPCLAKFRYQIVPLARRRRNLPHLASALPPPTPTPMQLARDEFVTPPSCWCTMSVKAAYEFGHVAITFEFVNVEEACARFQRLGGHRQKIDVRCIHLGPGRALGQLAPRRTNIVHQYRL